MLADISERGAAVLLPSDASPGVRVSFIVEWPARWLKASGVVRRRQDAGHGVLVGLEWPEKTGSAGARLSRLAAQLTARHYMLTFDHPWDRFGTLDLRRGHRRAEPRRKVEIPVLIGDADRSCWAVTEDMSSGGALIVSPEAFVAGTRVDLWPWDGAPLHADVVRCEELPGPPGRAWRIGLRLEQSIDLTGLVAASAAQETSSAAA